MDCSKKGHEFFRVSDDRIACSKCGEFRDAQTNAPAPVYVPPMYVPVVPWPNTPYEPWPVISGGTSTYVIPTDTTITVIS